MIMEEWLIPLICGGIVFLTFTAEGIAGFGATVLALPFVAMLTGIDKAVPMLSTCSVMLSAAIVCKSFRHIDFKKYGFILLHAGPGVPAGLFLMDHLPKNLLMTLLMCFMFFVGIRGLATAKRTTPPPVGTNGGKQIFHRVVLFLGGVIQGAFSSGGPLVVMYASKALPDKAVFRATLSTLWLTTNLTMITKWTVSGTVWTPRLGMMILCLIPFVLGGLLTGDLLHRCVDQVRFRILIYSLLVTAGVILGFNLLRQL